MSHKNIKRIFKDIASFESEKRDDMFIYYDDADIQHLKALIIGPPDTVFEGGFFYFLFDMTEFPKGPPKVKFLTPQTSGFRLHPNLYAEGKVCLSILNTWGNKEWSPLLGIGKIMTTIQALLDNNPIANEPAFYNMSEKHEKARHYAIMSRFLTMTSIPLMLDRKDIPIELKEKMINYILNNKDIYLHSFKELDKHMNEQVNTCHGNYIIKKYRFDIDELLLKHLC